MTAYLHRLWSRLVARSAPRPCQVCGGPGCLVFLPDGVIVRSVTGALLVLTTPVAAPAEWRCAACLPPGLRRR